MVNRDYTLSFFYPVADSYFIFSPVTNANSLKFSDAAKHFTIITITNHICKFP
jgi:hypothetical protein